MKKTLLSVLAGLTVIGSASAAPTPEDRKALCDLLIKKGTHVWVEKTKACIPVDPCNESEDSDIFKAYCIQPKSHYEGDARVYSMADYDYQTPQEIEARKLWVERFAKQVLHLDPVNIDLNLQSSGSEEFTKYPRFTTSDGGYYQIKVIGRYPNAVDTNKTLVIIDALSAYGIGEGDPDVDSTFWDPEVYVTFPGDNETFCNDIKDFAELLAQETFVESTRFLAAHNSCRIIYIKSNKYSGY